MANRRVMHNRALHDSLAAFVEEAAWQLADEVSGGAEVPFELMEANPPTRHSAPLYCYRPLTGRFIGERAGALGAPAVLPAPPCRAWPRCPTSPPTCRRAGAARRARTAARRPTPRCRRS